MENPLENQMETRFLHGALRSGCMGFLQYILPLSSLLFLTQLPG